MADEFGEDARIGCNDSGGHASKIRLVASVFLFGLDGNFSPLFVFSRGHSHGFSPGNIHNHRVDPLLGVAEECDGAVVFLMSLGS